MYDYNYSYGNNLISTSSSTGDSTWMIISLILAIVGGIIAYILFVMKPKAKEYTGFIAWLHDFLNFKKLFISTILKVTYIMCALYVTLASFAFIGSSAAAFFGLLIFGNIILRVIYEFLMLTITLVNNTTEINNKLNKK